MNTVGFIFGERTYLGNSHPPERAVPDGTEVINKGEHGSYYWNNDKQAQSTRYPGHHFVMFGVRIDPGGDTWCGLTQTGKAIAYGAEELSRFGSDVSGDWSNQMQPATIPDDQITTRFTDAFGNEDRFREGDSRIWRKGDEPGRRVELLLGINPPCSSVAGNEVGNGRDTEGGEVDRPDHFRAAETAVTSGPSPGSGREEEAGEDIPTVARATQPDAASRADESTVPSASGARSKPERSCTCVTL